MMHTHTLSHCDRAIGQVLHRLSFWLMHACVRTLEVRCAELWSARHDAKHKFARVQYRIKPVAVQSRTNQSCSMTECVFWLHGLFRNMKKKYIYISTILITIFKGLNTFWCRFNPKNDKSILANWLLYIIIDYTYVSGESITNQLVYHAPRTERLFRFAHSLWNLLFTCYMKKDRCIQFLMIQNHSKFAIAFLVNLE